MSTVGKTESVVNQSIDSSLVVFIRIEAVDGHVKFIEVKGTTNPNEQPLLIPHSNTLRPLRDLRDQIDEILAEAQRLGIRID